MSNRFKIWLALVGVPAALYAGPLSFNGIELTHDQKSRLHEIDREWRVRIDERTQSFSEAEVQLKESKANYELAVLDVLTEEQREIITAKQREKNREDIDHELKFLIDIAPLLKFALDNSDSMRVYEGSHHAGGTKLATAPADKAVKFKRFTFSSDPLSLPKDVSEKLQGMILNPRSFSAYRGGKFCGSFNPDVIIVFNKGERSFKMLLCFGCNEAMFVNGQEDFFTELPNRNDLFGLLRPQFQYWPDNSPVR